MVFIDDSYESWGYEGKWPSFLQHFHSVKVLRVEHEDVFAISRTPRPNHGESVIPDLLPILEEIEIRLGWAQCFHKTPSRANL